MKLAYNNSLSTIDDEFTATHHNWNITEIDLFLDRLLSG
jgi:hypothetical protein